MTVRAPLKYVDANTLQEMSSAEVTAWVDHICYLYGGNPSVTLTVDTGSAQNLQAMSDTRLQAGSTSTSASAFVAEGTTAEEPIATDDCRFMTGLIKHMQVYLQHQIREQHGQCILTPVVNQLLQCQLQISRIHFYILQLIS